MLLPVPSKAPISLNLPNRSKASFDPVSSENAPRSGQKGQLSVERKEASDGWDVYSR